MSAPTINGQQLPAASIDGPMRDSEEDLSRYVDGRRQRRRKGPFRLRLSWSWIFVGTAGEWAAVAALLEGDADGEFDFSPRGSADPYWPVRCRCTSDLPRLTPLSSRTASGEPHHTVEVTVEAVEVADARPPVEPGPVQLPPAEDGAAGLSVLFV